MPKLTDLSESETSSVLVFGPPKSGKTLAAGKLMELTQFDEMLMFSLENGEQTLRQLSKEAQVKINVIKIPDTRDYPMAIETCLKVVRGGSMTICLEHGKVNCPICKAQNKPVDTINLNDFNGKKSKLVLFDSVTQLVNSAMANISKGKPDDYKFDYDDWSHLGKVMDIFFSHIQAARYNVICISHEMPVEMNDGKEKLVAVAGTRNFSRNSAKYFGHVVYSQVMNKQHILDSSTTFANNILTGSRTRVDLGKDRKIGLEAIFS